MRRPCPIGWAAQLDKYLDSLKQSKPSPTDEFFCSLLTTEKHSHLTDKDLRLSDTSQSISLWEPKTLNIIQHIQRQIDDISFDPQNRLEKSMCLSPSGLRKYGIRMTNLTSSHQFWQIGQFTIRS